ncbi:MAG: glycosyltransferase [Catenulispora sp.]|nr:glycosyltransferase [Catenulispora sp.]
MRIAYVCRDLAVDDLLGVGAQTFSAADAMSRAGHQVYLVCEALAPGREQKVRSGGGPAWVPLAPSPAGHQYFTERQEYADRVYRTVSELRHEVGLDAIDFAAAEAITTIRAKRLLGMFPSTILAVRPGPEGMATSGARDIDDFDEAIAEFMSRYALDQADVVLADSTVLAEAIDGGGGRMQYCPPSSPPVAASHATAGDAYTIWHFGDLRPDAGVETFLQAAELLLHQNPEFRFVLAGRDTESDPFGRSYLEYATRRLSPRLKTALTFAGPPRDGSDSLPPPGKQCVLSCSIHQGPASARLAMALGQVITASSGTAAAESVVHGVTGRVVPCGDPGELAAVLLENAASPTKAARLAAAAAETGRDRATATEIAASYQARRSSCTPPAPAPTPAPAPAPQTADLISVVIPLWNQGRYLMDAIESVRAGGPQEVEIVVVDDGSTDPETIATFDALQDVVKVRQPNSGLSAARNAGIAAGSGRYVIPLDADDLLPDGFAAAALQALRRDPGLAYVTGHVHHFGLLDHTYVPVGHVPGLSLVLNTHARATGLFRKEAIEAVGGYDEELPACEDWDLYLSLAAAGYRSDVLPIVGQHYRRHPDSMTFSSSNAMRLPLLQYLLRKHAPKASADSAVELPLILAHLWKTGYEPSASVRLQQRDGRSL